MPGTKTQLLPSLAQPLAWQQHPRVLLVKILLGIPPETLSLAFIWPVHETWALGWTSACYLSWLFFFQHPSKFIRGRSFSRLPCISELFGLFPLHSSETRLGKCVFRSIILY